MQPLIKNRQDATRRCFIAGFSLTAFFGVLLNVVTYLATKGAYGGDGFEVIGFPFVFRKLGGFAGIYEFKLLALLADLLIILVASATVGYGLSRWCCQPHLHDNDTRA